MRAHRRRRTHSDADAASDAAAAATDFSSAPAPVSSLSDASLHHPTVLKPLPAHKPASAREQQFYEEIEQLRIKLRRHDQRAKHNVKQGSNDLHKQADASKQDSPDATGLPRLSRCSESMRCPGLAACESVDRDAELLRCWLSFFPRSFGTITLPAVQQHSAQAESHSSAVHPAAAAGSSSDASLAAPPSAASHTYLHLQDVTYPLTHPSLLDIKIGVQSSDPFVANADKIEREAAKCPAQATTGFRVCGARVWREPETSGGERSVDCYDKHWGRRVTVDEIERMFWTFFGHRDEQHAGSVCNTHLQANSAASSDVVAVSFSPSPIALRNASLIFPLLLPRLRTLLHLCTHAPRWRFYASSLLIAYQIDAGLERADTMEPTSHCASSSSSQSLSVVVSVHVIDFGHAYPLSMPLASSVAPGLSLRWSKPSACECGRDVSKSPVDANYLHGLEELIRILTRMSAAQE